MLALLLASISIITILALDNDESEAYADDGDNTVEGKHTGEETLSLYAGNDSYHARGADHVVYAGRGDDTYIFDSKSGQDVNATFWGSSGNDIMKITTESPNHITLFGGSGNDMFYEDSTSDVLMYGGRGDDVFDMTNTNFADGGEGNDTYLVHTNSDSTAPNILFDKASDSLVLELEGFDSSLTPEYEVLSDNTGILGTNIKVGDTTIVHLINETGALVNAVTHPMKNIEIRFV